jgi:hypothetical protein
VQKGKLREMRASTDQVRNATLDAVDAARSRASGLVSTGADLVTTTLDKGASVVEGGIERAAERTPMVSVAVAEPKRTHRVRTLLIVLGVLVVILAVAKKLTGQMEGAPTSDEPSRESSNGSSGSWSGSPEDDVHTVPAGSGGAGPAATSLSG